MFRILFFIIWASFFPLAAGIAPGTLITTPDGSALIEDLKPGDIICGYGPTTHLFSSVKIKSIEPVIVESIYAIVANHANKNNKATTIIASADQLFYEITSRSFVPAGKLKAGSLFLTKEIEAIECISIESRRAQALVYDLVLSDPHLFFSSEEQVLTHNAVPLLLGIPAAVPVLKFVVSAGTVAAVVYSEKLAKFLPSIFGSSRKRREREAQQQAMIAFFNQNNPSPNSERQKPSEPLVENVSPGGGQDPDPNDPKNKTKYSVIRGKGKAPKNGPPDSIYEKVDDKDPDMVVSRTTYNSDGRRATRDDFHRGSKPRPHFDRETKTKLKNHRHIFKYNDKGQSIGELIVPLEG